MSPTQRAYLCLVCEFTWHKSGQIVASLPRPQLPISVTEEDEGEEAGEYLDDKQFCVLSLVDTMNIFWDNFSLKLITSNDFCLPETATTPTVSTTIVIPAFVFSFDVSAIW